MDTGGGKVESLPENEGRIAQIWVNCSGGLQPFAFYFWLSKGWTARKEALSAAAKRPFVTARKLSSHRGPAVTTKEKGYGEKKKQQHVGGLWHSSKHSVKM